MPSAKRFPFALRPEAGMTCWFSCGTSPSLRFVWYVWRRSGVMSTEQQILSDRHVRNERGQRASSLEKGKQNRTAHVGTMHTCVACAVVRWTDQRGRLAGRVMCLAPDETCPRTWQRRRRRRRRRKVLEANNGMEGAHLIASRVLALLRKEAWP